MSRRLKPWPKNSALPRKVAHDLRRYALKWEERLGLNKTWLITYQVRKLDAAAEIRWADGYHNATIAFDEKYMDNVLLPPLDREHTVLHELLHLVFASMDDGFSDYYGSDGGCYGMYARHREAMCDTLATILLRKNAKPRTLARNNDVPTTSKRTSSQRSRRS